MEIRSGWWLIILLERSKCWPHITHHKIEKMSLSDVLFDPSESRLLNSELLQIWACTKIERNVPTVLPQTSNRLCFVETTKKLCMAGNKRSNKRQSNQMWNSGSGKRSKGRNSGSHSNNRPPTIDETAAAKMFQEIAEDSDPSVAGMEGICDLCEKLDLNAEEDIRVLVLLWKLGSKEKPAQISKQEWMSGCNRLQVDSIDKFQSILPSLDIGFLDRTEFKEFYKVRL